MSVRSADAAAAAAAAVVVDVVLLLGHPASLIARGSTLSHFDQRRPTVATAAAAANGGPMLAFANELNRAALFPVSQRHAAKEVIQEAIVTSP